MSRSWKAGMFWSRLNTRTEGGGEEWHLGGSRAGDTLVLLGFPQRRSAAKYNSWPIYCSLLLNQPPTNSRFHPWGVGVLQSVTGKQISESCLIRVTFLKRHWTQPRLIDGGRGGGRQWEGPVSLHSCSLENINVQNSMWQWFLSKKK